MGARVSRMFRNFNLDNRVHREISKEKPRPAPQHAVNMPPSAGSSEGGCLTSRLHVGLSARGQVKFSRQTQTRSLSFAVNPH